MDTIPTYSLTHSHIRSSSSSPPNAKLPLPISPPRPFHPPLPSTPQTRAPDQIPRPGRAAINPTLVPHALDSVSEKRIRALGIYEREVGEQDTAPAAGDEGPVVCEEFVPWVCGLAGGQTGEECWIGVVEEKRCGGGGGVEREMAFGSL
jgi:hypothetical protein